MSDSQGNQGKPGAPPPPKGAPRARPKATIPEQLKNLDFDPEEMVDALFETALSQHTGDAAPDNTAENAGAPGVGGLKDELSQGQPHTTSAKPAGARPSAPARAPRGISSETTGAPGVPGGGPSPAVKPSDAPKVSGGASAAGASPVAVVKPGTPAASAPFAALSRRNAPGAKSGAPPASSLPPSVGQSKAPPSMTAKPAKAAAAPLPPSTSGKHAPPGPSLSKASSAHPNAAPSPVAHATAKLPLIRPSGNGPVKIRAAAARSTPPATIAPRSGDPGTATKAVPAIRDLRSKYGTTQPLPPRPASLPPRTSPEPSADPAQMPAFAQAAPPGKAPTASIAQVPTNSACGGSTVEGTTAPRRAADSAGPEGSSAGPPEAASPKPSSVPLRHSVGAKPPEPASSPPPPSPRNAHLAVTVPPSAAAHAALLESYLDEERPTVQRHERPPNVARGPTGLSAPPAASHSRPPRPAIPRTTSAPPGERKSETPGAADYEFDADGNVPTIARVPGSPDGNTAPSSPRGSSRFVAALGSIDELPKVDASRDRAEWLERQALTQQDPKSKARSLTVVSELWAIVGETERAHRCASMALEANPHLSITQRQSRWLAAVQGDWEDVCSALDAELKLATTAEMRCHAAHLASCILEARLDDPTRARARAELALRSRSDDARGHIAAAVRELAATVAPPSVSIPDSPKLQELRRGIALLAHLRGGSPVDDDPHAAVVLENLGRRLATGDADSAAATALLLARLPGLEAAATWLAASLFAQSGTAPERSLELLRALHPASPSRSLLQATTELAWELGDTSCNDQLLEPEAKEAFPVASRLSYSLLGASRTAVLGELVAEATASPGLDPLVAAAQDVLSKGNFPSPLASELSARRIALGRAIAMGDISGTEPLMLADSLPNDPGPVALCLERGAARADATSCAAALKRWPEDDDRLPPVARLLTEGLLFELAGELEDARLPYDATLALEPLHEGAARALAACPSGPPLYELLESLADIVCDDERGALLLTEAARRRGENDDAYDSLLNRAAEVAPLLPFAYRAAEHAARARGNGTALVAWLQRRRETLTDPLAKALDCVREALLIAPHDTQEALRLLDDAAAVHPSDIALRELHERMSPLENGIERFTWRENVADQMPNSERIWLLFGLARECATAGDMERAARLCEAVLARDGCELHQRIAERLQTPGTAFAERVARAAAPLSGEEPREALGLRLERLLDLANDAPTHDDIRASLQAIEPLVPDSLALSRWAEHSGLGHLVPEDLETLATRIARLTSGNESEAHWRLALRMAQIPGSFEHSAEVFEKLLPYGADFGPWFVNARLQFALPSAPPAVQLEAVAEPLKAAPTFLDLAVLASTAAQASLSTSNPTAALAYIDQALGAVPDSPSALCLRAELLVKLSRSQEAAETFELYAELTGIDKYRAESLRRAGLIWIDRLGNAERGTAALERALELQPEDEAMFEQLRHIHVASGNRDKLVTLIEQRIALADRPETRSNLELMRARALMELGQTSGARDAVQMALTETPDSEHALELLASLCQGEADFWGERNALVRLLDLRSAPEDQAALQRRLGQLYSNHLDDAGAARTAFEATLDVLPADYAAGIGLARLIARSGPPEPALELLTRLIESAEAPESKREFSLALARLQSQLLGDQRVSERTFEKARRTWPGDPTVLVAFAEFLKARGDQTALTVLLDRASNEARRALGTGRFQTQFFESLEAVAQLRGDETSRIIIASSLAALRGEELTVEGAGASALDEAYDDFLAPDGLVLPLRALLRRAGQVIEAAYPYDLASVRAVELDPDSREWEEQLEAVAASVGVVGLRVLRSDRLETVCVAVASNPPTVVFGSALLASSDVRARDFLFARAVKILQAKANSLANASPLELWPMIAGFLGALAPSWSPSGLDPATLAAARSAMAAGLEPSLAAELAPLAQEVATTIGNRASQMGPLVNQWAARTALLAIGSPAAALRGVACALGQAPAPPSDPAERLKWVIRHGEARDLMSFSASEAYTLARRRLGLAELSSAH